MPLYHPPTNDNARLAFLQKSAITASSDNTNGNQYISDEILEQVNQLLPDYEVKVNGLNNLLSSRSKEIRERDSAFSLLQLTVRDFWEVLKRRIRRKNLPAEVLTLYELPLNGHIPFPSSNQEWLGITRKVINGDKIAIEKGYEAMENPSTKELEKLLEICETESSDVSVADRNYDLAQKEVAELRQEADALIEEIMAELRFNLRKLEPASQRRIMRSYGATFKSLPGEPANGEIPPQEA